jgi:hypothetical protein
MTHKHRKKFINFKFWTAGCSLLTAEVFSCSLDFSKLKFLIKQIFHLYLFSYSVFGHQFNEFGSTALFFAIIFELFGFCRLRVG